MADGIRPTKHRAEAGLTTSLPPEIQHYLMACENLLAGTDGSQDQFINASIALEQKTIDYTDMELATVHAMVQRVCERLSKEQERTDEERSTRRH